MIASDYQTESRMALKREAIPLPDFTDKRVLDIGCDFGYWSFLAIEKGATEVIGLDRNRYVKGLGDVDLIALNSERAHDMGFNCSFHKIDLGKQWFEYGTFDIVLCLSMYHHWFHNTGGDHQSIWYWLSRHIAPGGIVLWENPVDTTDSVVQMNVSSEFHSQYNPAAIMSAAARWFDVEYIGKARHVPTRVVYRFTRKPPLLSSWRGVAIDGAGGAAKAFEYAGGRRMKEIKNILGFMPFPGSLNLRGDRDFYIGTGYYRAQILDVAERGHGLDAEWAPRWARFYPLKANGMPAWAFRFEGENYRQDFVELIAPIRLRDQIQDRVQIDF